MYSEKAMARGEAIDFSHHLSSLARNRAMSPLKGLQKYFGKPGIISLAGGLPSPDYFPFDTIKADGLSFASFPAAAAPQTKGSFSWIWNIFSSSKVPTVPIFIPKYPTNPDEINLATSLQYSMAEGLPQLQKVIYEITIKVYKPAYADFKTVVHVGNTDGWLKTVTTLCNPGEGVLTSEWTYPSAIASMSPYGISPVPVSMDGQGMSSIGLRDMLSSWDEKTRAMPRPHVMYIVPIGQNPTGATMLATRKKEIYDICVQFDVIIVEDDPYYFLQEGAYLPPSRRSSSIEDSEPDDEHYIANLAPSFLKFDYQGRVVRLDTFSKTVAPGCRLGWFTCNPVFAERLTRQAETSTQAPCGFGQSLVTSLLINWQFTGYMRWLKGLSVQYKRRRDFFVDCLADKFHLELAPLIQNGFKGTELYLAYFQTGRFGQTSVRTPVFSFVPPTSGMYVWLQLNFDSHPKMKELGHESLERKLWIALAEAGLLVGPGMPNGDMFAANPSQDSDGNRGHFRISFSNAEFDVLKKAVDIFAKVMKDFYREI